MKEHLTIEVIKRKQDKKMKSADKKEDFRTKEYLIQYKLKKTNLKIFYQIEKILKIIDNTIKKIETCSKKLKR